MKNISSKIKKVPVFFSIAISYFSLYGTSIAQTTQNAIDVCKISANSTLKSIIMNFVIGCIFSRLVYLIVAAAVVVFLWGIFKFISSEGQDKESGKNLMFWGIVGLFVMISFWGIIAILRRTFIFNF